MTWQREAARAANALGAPPSILVEITRNTAHCRRTPAPGSSAASIERPSEWPSEPIAHCRPEALPFRTASIPTIAVSFLRTSPSAAARHAVLQELARVLTIEGALLVIDHNRPRRRAAAIAALVRPPHPLGRTPAERWRRASHPAAREARAAGFRIEALRLLRNERVQLVFARTAGRGTPKTVQMRGATE